MAIRLDNSFTVGADRDATWTTLLDVPLVVACVPGAELTETVSESAWKARMTVKLGPMTLVFAADVERTEVDPEACTMVITSSARELKGRGGANTRLAVAVARASGAGERARVDIGTDVTLSGTAAQFGRPVVQDVARRLVESFAACLQARLEPAPRDGALPAAHSDSPVPPVSGLGLALRALLRPITRLFHRPS